MHNFEQNERCLSKTKTELGFESVVKAKHLLNVKSCFFSLRLKNILGSRIAQTLVTQLKIIHLLIKKALISVPPQLIRALITK